MGKKEHSGSRNTECLKKICTQIYKEYQYYVFIAEPKISCSSKYCGMHSTDVISHNLKLKYLTRDLEQWYSTGGTRRHFMGYIQFKKIYVLFHDKLNNQGTI
jgi:hypothetical protein